MEAEILTFQNLLKRNVGGEFPTRIYSGTNSVGNVDTKLAADAHHNNSTRSTWGMLKVVSESILLSNCALSTKTGKWFPLRNTV